MKTGKSKKPLTLTSQEKPPAPANPIPPKAEDFEKDLNDVIKQAALEGAQTIKDMIGDESISDASRLAAAKWAVERVSKDNGAGAEAPALTHILDLVRQLKAAQSAEPGKKVEAPALPGEPEPTDSKTPGWAQWIASNFKH